MQSDDIIGIKILTEVEEDCKKVIRLLLDSHSTTFSNRKGIYLDPIDLERQPVKMRNGLEFYKIKGVYKNDFKFELQIKSKLLSVWGDMDHAMFYKDYSVSPVKKNVMETMVNLGSLITQVDKFLLQIREAENSFSKNRDVIDFTEKFSNKYSLPLKKKLGFGYRLEEISEFLFFMFQSLPNDKTMGKTELDFSLLNIKGHDELNKHYIKIRNTDFNLQIIELIFFNWFSLNYKEKNRKNNNFNNKIPDLLRKFEAFLVYHLTPELKHYSEYFEMNFDSIFLFLNSASVLYNFEKLNKFFEVLSNIITYSDIEIREDFENEKVTIKNFLLLTYYDQNAVIYIKSKSDPTFITVIIQILSNISFNYQDKKINEIYALKESENLILKSLIILKGITL